MDPIKLRKFAKLSPFEIKDDLIKLASRTASQTDLSFLNAGRGNPNWIATEPREAFFLLGQFAISESKRVLDLPPGVGGMPKKKDVSARLRDWLAKHSDMPGADFLARMVPWAVKQFSFDSDAFVHELVDSIIGDNYPVPDRMLVHNEKIVHEYLQWAMCGEPRPAGTFDLYAVEGGTAAMCYLFKSLKANRLIKAGDTIALAAPIFTPYLEMPHLEDYDLKIELVQTRQEDRFQLTEKELAKLLNKKVKAFFLANPGNPSAVALSAESIARVGAVLKKRPDLILLTDDVYGTFVPGFRSLMGAFPKNTIGVYSYSKYFGCTGWRLGVIALHQDNVLDRMLAKLPEAVKKKLDKRYGPMTLAPRKLKLIDRIVADSRDVALNHTAGLSLPQQVMMSLFSLYELMDAKKDYQKACIAIVRKRARATVDGLGIEVQRPATAVSADGPANLYNGVAAAISPEAKGRGVLVSLNDEIHYARNAVKMNTTSLQTFASPNRGPAGVVNTGHVEFFQRMDSKLGPASEFSVDKLDKLPRVDVIYAHASMSPDLIDAAVKAGAQGLVIAGVGDGNMTAPALDAVTKAAKAGVVVVRSTRLPTGRVLRNNEVNDDKLGLVASDELNPAKSRVLLQLALTKTKDPKAIQQMFYTY